MKVLQVSLSTVLCVLCFSVLQYSNAFQMKMILSPFPKTRFPTPRAPRGFPAPPGFPTPPGFPGFAPPGGLTGDIISNLAIVALKLRLAQEQGIKVDVTASSSDLLLKGKVGPVTVSGRGWRSGLGLSCRRIEATVESCELDIGRIISHQKLSFTTPALGNAMIALNSEDFGNFITHPLMKPPGVLGQSSGETIKFLKENVQIDSNDGSVRFYGTYLGDEWEFVLTRGAGKKKAVISVMPLSSSPENASLAAELTEVIEAFFNKMVFELDGTSLSFKDMMVTNKGPGSSVMLDLNIKVRKLPSSDLAF